MATVTRMKCACEACLCIVDLSNAVEHDAQYYCGEACASGHASGSGCEHSGCNYC